MPLIYKLQIEAANKTGFHFVLALIQMNLHKLNSGFMLPHSPKRQQTVRKLDTKAKVLFEKPFNRNDNIKIQPLLPCLVLVSIILITASAILDCIPFETFQVKE